MDEKKCKICDVMKPLDAFGKRQETRSDGTPYTYYRPNCNACRRVKEKVYRDTPASRLRRAEYQKEYDQRPRSKELALSRRQTQKYKEYMKEYRRNYKRTEEAMKKYSARVRARTEQQDLFEQGLRRCATCKEIKTLEEDFYYHRKAGSHEYTYSCKKCKCAKGAKTRQTPEHQEYMREYQKKWRKTEKYKVARDRRRSTPASRFRESISTQVRGHIIKATLGGKKKGGRLFDHLPYTIEEMKAHIECLFQDGMTWDNYGKWQIDHIVPQAKLQYDSFEHPNFTKCWALENLQPLWSNHNTRKGSFYEGVNWVYGKSPEEQRQANAETIEAYRLARQNLVAKYVDIDTLVFCEDKDGGEISFEVKDKESLYQDIKDLRKTNAVSSAGVTHELREGIMDIVMLGYDEGAYVDKE